MDERYGQETENFIDEEFAKTYEKDRKGEGYPIQSPKIRLEHFERELYKELISATCEYLTQFLWYVLLLALGAWLAFYWMKHREEEDNG